MCSNYNTAGFAVWQEVTGYAAAPRFAVNMSDKWPQGVERFLKSIEWTFAKTYAKTWPHHYIVRDQVDTEMFAKAVSHIRQHGYVGRFYQRKITYLERDGLIYWTMVPPKDDPGWYPVEEETIINRCPVESSYEYRLKNGTLPDPKSS